MKLSILIPTMTDRKILFDRLKQRLEKLALPYKDQIEILHEEDEGEKISGVTTGMKRNKLIDRAQGDFSAFIDDDDDVPDWYFESIFRVFHNEPDCDCIGFKGLLFWIDPRNRQQRTDTFKHAHGLPYSPNKIHGEWLRPPNHLNPMRTEYFRQIRFPDLTFAEDFDFCLRLQKADLIKNPKFLNIVMYHYKYKPKNESKPVTNITEPITSPVELRTDAETGNASATE